jgi:ferredoxin
MTYVITQQCIGTCDTACVDVCPTDCILGPIPLEELRRVPLAERGQKFPGLQMFIDPDLCVHCDACLKECPVAAIYAEEDLPEAHRGDLERNAKFFQR